MGNKLIIIRGPSASGKSTVADKLFQQTARPTLLVSEDTIRKMFNDHQKRGHVASRKLAMQMVIAGLENGYDVIYHGILRINDGNENRFDAILKVHPDENYFFYLDVGLEETIRRHESRPKNTHFDSETMKKWWEFSSPTGHQSETLIQESSSLEDSIKTISKVAGIALNN